MSIAGNPTARTRSEPQIAPTLYIGLPERWFVTFYPSNDIRINYDRPVSGQTDRLFLPFDAAVGRKVNRRPSDLAGSWSADHQRLSSLQL